jgi:RNA polymerase sigma-70 factor, ECF subfamily
LTIDLLTPDEQQVIAALRAGDELAFATLVDRYTPSMLRVARMYVATKEAAEDVVQETWLGVIRGIETFEGRSTLKTWMFRILVNRAQTRGERESRTTPFSSLSTSSDDAGDHEPAVDPSRFVESGRWTGWWSQPPSAKHLPEAQVLVAESGTLLLAAVDALPANQRIVITLRDIHGLTSEEVCDLLSISEGNQRVLLHRARAKVRGALEDYLNDGVGNG